MIPRAEITAARSVTSVEAIRPSDPVGDARQEAFNRWVSQFAVGKQFQGQVLSRLVDDAFMVKVADTPVRMSLPPGVQVGDTLDLTLAGTHPRPTFTLGAPPADPHTSLSNTARLIDNLLQAAQKAGAPAALMGKTPVVPSPAAGTVQVATALKETLTFSGLFYESHLEQWVNGERPLSELMREPQAKNSSASLLAATMQTPALSAATQAQAHTDAMKPTMNGAEAAQPVAMEESGATPPAAGNPMPNDRSSITTLSPRSTEVPPSPADTVAAGSTTHTLPIDVENQSRPDAIHPESARMISLQLDTLEQQRVAWQGELWPGQPMEWEVSEDKQNTSGSDAERSWQSVVRFELPTLGVVAASIRLTGNRLQVQVRTAEDNAASLLRKHGTELASALEAAGSPLDLLTVKRDEAV